MFVLIFAYLLSGEVDASCQKSEPVYKIELTDSTENHIVYDGETLFSFRLWLHSENFFQHVWYFEPNLEHIVFTSGFRHTLSIYI